jgi:hypothetical protein
LKIERQVTKSAKEETPRRVSVFDSLLGVLILAACRVGVHPI